MHNSALAYNCVLVRNIFMQVVGTIFCHSLFDIYNALAQQAYVCVYIKSVIRCACHFVPEPPLFQIPETCFV